MWEVIDAILAKFKHRFSGIDPSELQLLVLDDSSSTSQPIVLSLTLSEAGIHSGTKLAVIIIGHGVYQVLGTTINGKFGVPPLLSFTLQMIRGHYQSHRPSPSVV